jgi:sugar phosphate isomerase/epimerase
LSLIPHPLITQNLEVLMSAATDRSTRRRFLGWAGAGAAASLAAGFGDAAETSAVAPATAGKPTAYRFSLGVVSYTFKDFSLEKALAMTNRVGLKHICLKSFHLPLESKPEEIAHVAKQVKQAGLDLYGGGVIYMQSPAEVQQAFDYAKAAGMGVIVAAPLAELLPLVDEKVRAYDIRLAIHNHGPGDKLFPTPESAYRKIEKLDPRVGLCMDIGHTVRAGVDPVRDAQRFADRLLDVHLKDVSAASPAGQTVEIGRGVIRIPQFLRALIETGYSGKLGFEFEKDSKDPLPGLAESVGYTNGVLAVISPSPSGRGRSEGTGMDELFSASPHPNPLPEGEGTR